MPAASKIDVYSSSVAMEKEEEEIRKLNQNYSTQRSKTKLNRLEPEKMKLSWFG
jgi:hypothetical protein